MDEVDESARDGVGEEELPRGVRLLKRGDAVKYTARVACLREGVKTLGEFRTASEASAAWDAEMRRRFPLSSIASVLNDASAVTAADLGTERSGAAFGASPPPVDGDGEPIEQLEALLGDDAWHDVNFCGLGPGGLAFLVHPMRLLTAPRVDCMLIAALLALCLSTHEFRCTSVPLTATL